MKKTLLIIIVVAILIMIVLLLKQKNTSASTEQLENISIAVSKTPLSTPFFVAQEKGFFTQHGLNVDFKEVHGGQKSFQKMINNEVDYATSSDSVMMFNSLKYDDFSCLTTFVQSKNDIKILTLSKYNIKNAEDFMGKKVAVIKNSASDYFFYTYLMLDNVDINAVTIVHLSPQDMFKALKDKQVDAVSVWEPYAYKIKQQLKSAITIQPTKNLYNLTFNLFAKNSYIKENPKNNKKLIFALSDAVDYIRENEKEAQVLVMKRLNLDHSFINWVWKDYLFSLSLKSSLLNTLKSEVAWAIQNNLSDKKSAPDFTQFINSEAYLAKFPEQAEFNSY